MFFTVYLFQSLGQRGQFCCCAERMLWGPTIKGSWNSRHCGWLCAIAPHSPYLFQAKHPPSESPIESLLVWRCSQKNMAKAISKSSMRNPLLSDSDRGGSSLTTLIWLLPRSFWRSCVTSQVSLLARPNSSGGGRLKQLLAFSFAFPQVVKMHDWPSMKTGTGGCRAAPRTSLNQSCLPAVLLQSHASQFVLRDLAILALKNSRLAEEVVLRRETLLAVFHNMSDGPCRDL